jgi:hypothetical protein
MSLIALIIFQYNLSVTNCVNYIIIHVLFLLIFFLYTIHFKSYILIETKIYLFILFKYVIYIYIKLILKNDVFKL